MSGWAPRFAQTNVELSAQMSDLNYGPDDVALVSSSYEMATVLFAGRFEPCGKIFLGHVVGTASILAWLGEPGYLIAAGLVHNVYRNGDFGFGATGPSTGRRREVERALGVAAERCLHDFFRWTQVPAAKRFKQLERLDPRTLKASERDVFVVLVADQLEKTLFDEVLFNRDACARMQRLEQSMPALTHVARVLGHRRAADALRSQFERLRGQRVPEPLVSISRERRSRVFLPTQYTRKLSRRAEMKMRAGFSLAGTMGSRAWRVGQGLLRPAP